MRKKVLIVVDMQNDFVTGCLGTKEAQKIVSPMAEFIKKWTEEGGIVIFTQDTHGSDYMNTQEGKRLPVAHCLVNTKGWGVVDELKEYQELPDTYTIYKPSFGTLEMAEHLQEIKENVEEIYLCGVCTGICVISNAVVAKATLPEVRISIISDLCACVTPESHQTALDAMGMLQMDIVEAEKVFK